jgi:rhodanese-related sulfurtransferase
MQIKRVLLFLLVTLLLAACGSTSQEASQPARPGEEVQVAGGVYKDVTASELKTMLESKDFFFVNVHIPFEGDISGTDDSIPYNEIEENLDRLPQDKDAKIFLYCRSDRMSRIAAETLIKNGYTNVWNLDGGMVAWEEAGYALEGR